MKKYLILLIVPILLCGCGFEQNTTKGTEISNIQNSQEEQLPKEVKDFQDGYNKTVSEMANRSIKNMERTEKNEN